MRAPSIAFHANAGPTAFCAARHRPLAAFQPHFLVLSVESAARRWLCRVWHRQNTPDAWQKRKLMAADCLVSLDAFLSRLLSWPDSRAICSCVSICFLPSHSNGKTVSSSGAPVVLLQPTAPEQSIYSEFTPHPLRPRPRSTQRISLRSRLQSRKTSL